MTENTETVKIPVIAGYNEQSEPIVEQLLAVASSEDGGDVFRLQRSPVFVRNLAAGDKIRASNQHEQGYELLERSGNLSIRVFSKDNIENLELMLTPEFELLDGRLDLKTDRILIYTIHVSMGFAPVEAILDGALGQYRDSVWYYGNVYDPADGVTPLNWWEEYLNTA